MPPMNCERAVFGLMTRPDREHAEHARDADLAAVGVDPHLDELRAERVAGELVLGLDLVAGVDRDLALALLEQGLARAHDGGAPRGGAHRAAGDGRDAEVGVADLEPHVLGVDAERVGGDLGEHGAGAGADVGGGDLDRVAVGVEARGRLGGRAVGGVGRGGDAGADQPAAVGRAARDRPSRSARRPRAGRRRGCARRTGCPSRGRGRARCGCAARSGRWPSAIASSSIADSSANMPGHSPGARIHDGRGDVERDEPVAGQAVGRRVHHARGRAGLLGELAHRRGLLEGLVGDRGEHAVLGRRRGGRAGSSACGSRRWRTSAGA